MCTVSFGNTMVHTSSYIKGCILLNSKITGGLCNTENTNVNKFEILRDLLHVHSIKLGVRLRYPSVINTKTRQSLGSRLISQLA